MSYKTAIKIIISVFNHNRYNFSELHRGNGQFILEDQKPTMFKGKPSQNEI